MLSSFWYENSIFWERGCIYYSLGVRLHTVWEFECSQKWESVNRKTTLYTHGERLGYSCCLITFDFDHNQNLEERTAEQSHLEIDNFFWCVFHQNASVVIRMKVKKCEYAPIFIAMYLLEVKGWWGLLYLFYLLNSAIQQPRTSSLLSWLSVPLRGFPAHSLLHKQLLPSLAVQVATKFGGGQLHRGGAWIV